MLEEPARIYDDQPPLTIATAWGRVRVEVVTATHLELAATMAIDGHDETVRATATRRDETWHLSFPGGPGDETAGGQGSDRLDASARDRQVTRHLLAVLDDTTGSPSQMRRIYEHAARNRDAMADGLSRLHTIAVEHAIRQETLAQVLAPDSPRQQRALAQARQRRAQATFLAVRIEQLGGTISVR